MERRDAEMTTEDFAHVLLRFEGGARGSLVISQVSAGRKNSLRFELDGSRGALAWDSERQEELWLGHRDRPNEVLTRNPALLSPQAQLRTHLPAAHAEGFADTFRELYRAVYAAVAAGGPPASRTTRRSRTGTGRTCSATRSRSRTSNDDGWRCRQ